MQGSVLMTLKHRFFQEFVSEGFHELNPHPTRQASAPAGKKSTEKQQSDGLGCVNIRGNHGVVGFLV